MRVQHVMRELLVDALTPLPGRRLPAGVMMDIKTGEDHRAGVAAGFRSERPGSMIALQQAGDAFNRITAGKYELGSTMKTVTIAGALDSGKVKITDKFDARFGVRFGRFTITDFHGKNRILTCPEVYKYLVQRRRHPHDAAMG